MIKGILFDFDGTIVNSEVSRFKSSQEILKKYGFDLTEQLWEYKYKALSSKALFEDVIQVLNLTTSSDELYEQAHELRKSIERDQGVEIIEGFKEFYQECISYNLHCIVCSGGTSEHVQRILEQCDIQIQGFGREEYINRKPYPDAWLKGIELLGLSKEEVLIFDDASTGIEAGLRAGVEKCCAINYNNEDFKEIEHTEKLFGIRVYKYFKNWKDVELKKLIYE
jgi:beta-phosphoglucomutase-like phosphatase (HAD superfamily)